ncbi:MAG: hypothetical protein ACYCOU_04270 [Sulfobacillus sp.]
MSDAPLLALAQVIGHDPDGDGVYVWFRSGQGAGYPVRMGHSGAADGLRIDQKELPVKGTWGLVAFPNEDQRNGVWICAYNAIQADAITSGPGEEFTRYLSHWSGYWELLDEAGNKTQMFPDGTSIVVSDTGLPAITYRHIVDENQVRQRVELTQAERVPNTPPPKIINLSHPSGTNITISETGGLTGNVAGDLALNVSGNATLAVSGTVTGSATSWAMTGNVTWTGNLQVDGTIMASGAISDFNGAYGSMQAMRVTYNSHYHGGVQTGSGDSAVATPQMTD